MAHKAAEVAIGSRGPYLGRASGRWGPFISVVGTEWDLRVGRQVNDDVSGRRSCYLSMTSCRPAIIESSRSCGQIIVSCAGLRAVFGMVWRLQPAAQRGFVPASHGRRRQKSALKSLHHRVLTLL
ncbi:hypothetical protein Bbelb_229940 [Branchiostoma belcheri]|nr:hypothetical protein Bbelb_229940 [Branchiostoma belcheri]